MPAGQRERIWARCEAASGYFAMQEDSLSKDVERIRFGEWE